MSDVIIRPINAEDEKRINAALSGMGWSERPGLYLSYAAQEARGEIRTFVAERDDEVLGYVTLQLNPTTGPFAGRGWPEIKDFNVIDRYRRQGIGSRLMDAAEDAARELSDVVTIAVGLNRDYGPAQRLYVKRGYVPDGSGAWYGEQPAKPYQSYCNDDDLMIYLSKELR
ncbi:MAG: GNAT family N-acetyltransferase [Clostridia bacterium]|nr:GNAT family N-acetyltransferase [Clostridia bacterium]